MGVPETQRQLAVNPGREIDARGRVNVVTCARPFLTARVIHQIPEGGTIREILQAIGVRLQRGIKLTVQVGGYPIPEALWDRIRPKAAAQLVVKATPAGGGDGGGSGRAALTILVAIVAIAAFVFVAPLAAAGLGALGLGATAAGYGGLIAGGLAAGVVSFAGGLAVNAIAPPPQPELGRLSGSGGGQDRASQTLFLRGARNQASPFGVIPRVMGRHRMIPPYAVAPYTEDHADIWMAAAFCVGYGPVLIDDIRIGEVSVDDFEEIAVDTAFGFANDPTLQVEIDDERSAIPQVRGDDYNVLLEEGEPVVRTTAPNTDQIAVDIHFPRGLVLINDEGEYEKRKVELRFEYAPVGTGNWTARSGDDEDNDGEETVEGNDTSALYKSWVWKVARGQYDVRITRLNENDEGKDEHLFDEAWLSKLTSYRFDPPVNKPGMAMFSIGVRASDQINGVLDTVNAVIWSLLPDLGAHQVRFDGGKEHLRAKYGEVSGDRLSPNITGAGARTYEWWMLAETDGAETQGVFEDGFGNGAGRDFCFRLQSKATETWRLDFGGGTVFDQAVSGSVDGDWHHWAITYDGTDARLYFDGVEQGTARTVALNTAADRLRVAEVNGVRFRGRIRDFRKWSVARSQSEIDDNKANVYTGMPSETIPADIISLYPMHEGRGGWCIDLGPRRNHLQHMNTPSWHDVSGTVTEYWAIRPTSNPASIFREILQGSANRNPVADSRIDLTTLEAWHVWNREKGNAFNMVLDFPSTVFERLRSVAGAGLASFTMRDGKYSVVMDRQQEQVIQHFTPLNSWGFQGRKVFRDVPTALKIRFVNADNDWQQDERTVYDDGHDENTDNVFENLELPGITDPDQVWRHGRHHIAVSKLRPETYELRVDVEHMVCTRGDLVKVTHDIMLVGLGWGRIKAVSLDGDGKALALQTDERFTMEAGKTYQVTVRGDTGASYTHTVITEEGEWNTLRLSTPTADGIQAGDLLMFGESGKVTSNMLVKSVEPHEDMTALLTLVDESPGIYTAADGEIPPWNPNITLPPDDERMPPPPTITHIVADESALLRDGDGAFIVRAMLTISYSSGRWQPPDRVETQFRIAGSSGWASTGMQPLQGRVIYVTGVEERRYYEFRVRTVSRLGQISEWSAYHSAYIIGKTSLPPTVQGLRVTELSGGTRKISWSTANQPLDYRGVKIRYYLGSTSDWSAMTDLADTIYAESPVETVRPTAGGAYTFAAKAVDYSGNESANAAFYEVELDAIPTPGVKVFQDAREMGWPGTLGAQNYIEDGVIRGGSSATWDTWETAPETWDTLETWQDGAAATLTYTHTAIDLGASKAYRVTTWGKLAGDFNTQVQMSYSDDGVNYSAFENVGVFTGRYVIVKVTAPPLPTPDNEVVLSELHITVEPMTTDVPTMADEPDSATEGQLYANSTDHKLYYYTGSAWVALN